MKKCVQCQRTYNDETKFCLEDGARLVAIQASAVDDETVFGAAPPHSAATDKQTIRISPIASENVFAAAPNRAAPPNNAAPLVAAERTRSKLLLPVLAAASLLILLGGAAILGVFVFSSKNPATANSPTANRDANSAAQQQNSATATETPDLQTQQARLDKERQRLADERRRLEADKTAAKKTAAQTNESAEKAESNKQTAAKTVSVPLPGGGGWFVILGTFDREDARSGERLQQMRDLGINATIIDTDNYPKFAAGKDAVVLGPYSKDVATRTAAQIKSVRPDAYAKSGF